MVSQASDETTEVTSKQKTIHHRHHPQEMEVEVEVEVEEPPPTMMMKQETLARQSSIYSLTLDEIQNTVCDPNKHFGSMNMDEFIANIWNAEEAAECGADIPPPQLHRQGSLTLPAPLSGKTVDQVWAEIHRDCGAQPQPAAFHRHVDDCQPTYGEMTLEDFLVKAGVVREGPPPPPAAAATQPYGMVGYNPDAGYGEHHHHANGVYQIDGGGSGGGRRSSNGYNNGTPGSPVSEDGLGGGLVDDSGVCGVNGGVEGRINGRKRSADGSVEKVVERRQRRMIKNRESAARSRARKQAYTVELEAELNQLKEENTRLREEQKRVVAFRKQLILEAMAERALANVMNTTRKLRRCRSCTW